MRRLTQMACLGIALCAAGCTPHTHPLSPPQTQPWQMQIETMTHPTYPQQMDGTRFFALVSDKNHKPVRGASVTIYLAMPTMDMGRNEIKLHEWTTPGTYTGTGRFSMPGDWQMTVSADKGAAHQSRTFPVSVR